MSFWSRAKTFIAGTSMTQKVLLANAGIFLCWRFKPIPEQFMAKHFSLSRFNLDGGRLHTIVTHGFSNMYFPSFLFDALTIFLFGNSIEKRLGGNRFLKLFMMGTILGGLTIATFDRRAPFMIPNMGATTAVTSMLTFEACRNMGQRIIFFVFPMRIEFLVGFILFQALFLDPLHRNVGGVAAGALAFFLFRRGMF